MSQRLVDRATALDVCDELWVELAISSRAHDTSESLSWLPLGRRAWCRLLHHAVDLLEGEALGLWDEEPGVDEGASAETAPDEEDAGLQIALVLTNHVWGNDSDDLGKLAGFSDAD